MTITNFAIVDNCDNSQGVFISREGQTRGTIVSFPFCPDCPVTDADNAGTLFEIHEGAVKCSRGSTKLISPAESTTASVVKAETAQNSFVSGERERG